MKVGLGVGSVSESEEAVRDSCSGCRRKYSAESVAEGGLLVGGSGCRREESSGRLSSSEDQAMG